jgi:hypothetical protein
MTTQAQEIVEFKLQPALAECALHRQRLHQASRVRQFTPDFPVDFQLNQRLTAGFRNSCGGTFY